MSNSIKERMYISTVCERVVELSKKYECGIEIANFSYAENMDTYFNETKILVDSYTKITDNFIFHAPFYELSMCAIDPLAKELTYKRFNQFYNIAKDYNPKKLVFHTGYIYPGYFVEWFVPKTAEFLNEFSKDKKIELCIENVLETDPMMFFNIMKKINNDNIKICLDIGHINVYGKSKTNSKIQIDNKINGTDLVCQWIEILAPYISHFHLHNNNGDIDKHLDINDGVIDINKIIAFAEKKVDNPTYTFEIIDVKSELPINGMLVKV